MEESILTSIKKLLGIEKDYTHFDQDIMMHINTVFMILTQVGLGPEEGFFIEDDKSTWANFINDLSLFQGVKTYVYLKVKLLFDPPASSAVMESFKSCIAELEWRLNINAESS